MTFRGKLSANYYDGNDIPYPKSVRKSDIEKEVKDSFIGTYNQILMEIENRYAVLVAENKNNYKEYRHQHQLLEEEFKKDLLDEYGVTNNPKASLCYRIAYDRAHSDGFSSVESNFSELVELIQ